jgi:hypothetical protein
MTSGVHALDGAADFARKQVGNNNIRCFALGQILGAGTGRVEVLVADFESHRFPSNVPTTGGRRGTKFKEFEPDASARRIFKTCYGVQGNGQTCARPGEQGCVEPDGGEMASMC